MNDDIKKYQEEIDRLNSQVRDLEIAFNFTHDGLHLLDGEGYTILVNASCQENEGLKWEKIKGKKISQLVEEGFLSESVTLKVLKEKKTITLIQQVKDGKEMIVTGTPIFDGDRITRVMVNSRDITELNLFKKQLAETEMRFQAARNKINELRMADNMSSEIIYKSSEMGKVINTAIIVAKVNSNVLITGESGTGKGLVSQLIHENSNRKDKPYLRIDCGSLPESLIESELFGYEPGSFTGASTSGKIGLLEVASGGTLFLDEIGEISLGIQSKLLRAVQDKEIVRIGGKSAINIDVRIISATNRNLEAMVENRTFREDLFYRLNVVPIYIPPLRERMEDVQILVLRILQNLNKKYNQEKKIDLDAMETLMDYDWKGNVRELENLVERLYILTEKNLIGRADLPISILKKSGMNQPLHHEGNTLEQMHHDFERNVIQSFINRGWKPTEVAKTLDVDVTTIRRKMKKYGIVR